VDAREALEARVQAEIERDARVSWESPDPLLRVTSDGRIDGENAAARVLLGGSYRGKMLGDLLEVESATTLLGLLRAGFAGGAHAEIRLRDGRSVRFAALRTKDAEVLLVLGRPMAASLPHDGRRLGSVMRLAAALSHELSAPLSVILGRLEMLGTGRHLSRELLDHQLGLMRANCGRVAVLVQNLQTLAAPQLPRQVWHPLRQTIQKATDCVGRRMDRIQLEVQLVPTELTVFADPAQLVHMLSNLVVVAISTSPFGGVVRLIARHGAQRMLQLAITDRGPGLSPEVLAEFQRPLPRMIDPGVSLELSIASILAQGHGGRLNVENRHHAGTTYEILLPQIDCVPAADARRTVLVVDDDSLLGETVACMLPEEQYRVTHVQSAAEAMAEIRRQPFDVLLIDIRLSGISGDALAEDIATHHPSLARRIVLMSGVRYQPRQPHPYLGKPFTATALEAVIADRLNDGPG